MNCLKLRRDFKFFTKSLFSIFFIFFYSFGLSFAHAGIPSEPTTACGSIDSVDLTTHTGNQIDSRATGGSALTDYKLFSTTGTNASSSWVRNTSVWTNSGTDIDWTGISPWNSDGLNQKASTLISPRHVVMASHYSVPAGSTVTFVDNNNIAYDRTITATQSISGTDITIGLLDSDVPDSVTYYPIMSNTNLQATLKKYEPMVYDVPFIAFDQDKNVIIRSFHNIASGFIFHHLYTSGVRSTFSQDIVGGDSGNPAFILIDNRPVLLFSHESGGAGPNYGNYITEINSVMNSLGGGYSATQYSPTCFNQYTPNNLPVFTNSNATSTLAHYSASTPIFAYSATDSDSGQSLSFQIIGLSSVSNPSLSLNASDYFSLNPTTGVLTQTADINNYPLGNALHLAVAVRDNASNIATTTATTTINITYPILSNAVVLDSVIELDYSQNIATTSVPSVSDFSVEVNNASRSVSSVSIIDDKVILGLSSAISSGDSVTLTYTPGTNKIKDRNGAFASAISSELTIPTSTDGNLDTTFDPGTGFSTTANRLLIQSDGKILVGGAFTSYNGTNSTFLIRLNTDGSVDPSFTSYFNSVNGDSINLIKQQSDGKILIGGTLLQYNGSTIPTLIRLNSDGSLDSSFAFPFYYSTTDNNEVKTFHLQSDGKIIAAFAATPSYNDLTSPSGSAKIYRFNSDGSLDPSFSAGGVGPSTTGTTFRMTGQSDGKIVISGAFTSYSGTSRNRIARINSDGSLDSSFTVGTGFSVSTTSLQSTVIQSDGKIIVAGAFNVYNGTARNKILRLNTDGSLDTTFNTTGTGFGASTTTISSMVLQSDGKIIVSGNFNSYNGTARSRIARLNSDGTLDNTFDPLTSFDSTATAVALDSSGDIYALGTFTTYGGVSRSRIAKINANTTADVEYPYITSVTSSASDGTYKEGDSISIQVVFSELVDVNTTGGTPSLTLETGDTNRSATYSSGSGSDTLVFSYVVSAGDIASDLDYVATSSLSFNGGTIYDSSLGSNYLADLSLPDPGTGGSLGANKNIEIDGVKPEEFISFVDGNSLSIIYDLGYSSLSADTDSLNTNSSPSASAFSVYVNGTPFSVSSVSVSDHSVDLIISYNVLYSQTVKVSYTAPASNYVKDSAGNSASSFSLLSVTNNTEEPEAVNETPSQLGGGSRVRSLISSNLDKQNINNQSNLSKFFFSNNLLLGNSGDSDVKKLQQFLNKNGFLVAKSGPGSVGKETDYFGSATKSALIKFQKSVGIKPAVGFFGPLTRAYINNLK